MSDDVCVITGGGSGIGRATAALMGERGYRIVLAGRTPEAKQDLSGRIADVLRRLTPRPPGVMVQLSVEIVDMDRPSYVKERL